MSFVRARWRFVLFFTFAVALATEACVGDAEIAPASGTSGAPAPDASTEAGPLAPPPDSGGSSGTSGSSGSSGSSGVIDSGPDGAPEGDGGPDASLPTVGCIDQPLNTGAIAHRCSAVKLTLTPGGGLAVGLYNHHRSWQEGGCGPNQEFTIGSAEVFQENGRTFMRWVTTRAPSSGTGVTIHGTWWLEPDGAGNIKRTELCNPALKGTSEVVSYEQTPATPTTLTMNVGTVYQETWQHL
jgi:hypothetical protein